MDSFDPKDRASARDGPHLQRVGAHEDLLDDEEEGDDEKSWKRRSSKIENHTLFLNRVNFNAWTNVLKIRYTLMDCCIVDNQH